MKRLVLDRSIDYRMELPIPAPIRSTAPLKPPALILAAGLVALVSCQRKNPSLGEDVSDKVGDAPTPRSRDEVRDAAEDLPKGRRTAGEGMGQDARELTG